MSDRPSTPELLREWGRMPVPVDDSANDEERRARIVSQVARTIRETAVERSRSQQRRRWAALLAVAAAVALLIGGSWGPLRRSSGAGAPPAVASLKASSAGVVVSRAGAPQVAPLDAATALQVGDAVSSVVNARAELRLASGVEVEMAGSTSVLLSEASETGEVVQLDLGEVAVHAPPLGARSFTLRTPDARVVIHGTRFTVTVRKSGDETQTEVSVSEGKVAVYRGDSEALLTPGQSWSSSPKGNGAPAGASAKSPNPPDAPPAPTTPTNGIVAKPSPAADPFASAKPGKPIAATDPSALAEQNKLYAAAVGARQRGDDRGAVGHLNSLLTRYPNSPLAPEARVERFRALKRLGKDAEAASEARRYLLEHRDGAARDEARDLALQPKSK